MPFSTNMILTQDPVPTDIPVSSWQDEVEKFEPMEDFFVSTLPSDPDLASGIELTQEAQGLQKKFEPPVMRISLPVGADSTPLQIWEGTVIEVDLEADVMQVLLDAKIGKMSRHTGEIDLEWVSDQDKDLVRPGAVFYLTLFKRTKRGGSIENSQELRFRRRPAWSATQLKRVKEDADELLSRMKPLPTSV